MKKIIVFMLISFMFSFVNCTKECKFTGSDCERAKAIYEAGQGKDGCSLANNVPGDDCATSWE